LQFSISFDTANSPDLGSLTGAEQQAVLDAANAAAAIWSRYLAPANVTLDLQIKVDDSLLSGGVLAQGSPGDFVATGATFGGQQVYDAGSAVKLRTGQDSNGAQADLSIDLTVASIRSMFFKTDEYAPVPPGDTDALSVFLREISHGLGMFSLVGQPGAPGVSVYDTFVENDVSGPRFTGYNAILQYGWASPGVLLDSTNVANLAESNSDPDPMSPLANPGADLMSAVVDPDTNIHISALDLGILQDLGVPVNVPTQGDDIVYALDGQYTYLWDGDDTGYALANGSDIGGGDGNDRLIGNIGNDTLNGEAGDDYFEGGGGNNQINGGTGFDIAHYTGLASDYHITQYGGGSADIQDLRPGLRDGSDHLTNIEELQWGDGSFLLLDNVPVVTTQAVGAHPNQTFALSSLFSVSDPDGDAITAYRIYSGAPQGGPSSGAFTVGGVLQQRGTVIDITPAQIPFVTYATTAQSDIVTIQVFDGTLWSNWSQFTVSVHAANQAPVVTTGDRNLAAGQSVTLASLINVSDADSDVMTRYQLYDATGNASSGHFVINGVIQSSNMTLDISAAQAALTTFVAGSVGDHIEIRAYDGLAWSAADTAVWAPFTVSPPVNHAPVVATTNIRASAGQSITLADLITVSDTDGDAMTRYQLYDATGNASSGHFVVNGVAQPSNIVIDLTATQAAQTSFVAGAVNDDIQIRVYDGQAWSAADTANWAPFALGPTTNNAPVVTTTNIRASAGQSITLASLITVSDADGDAMTRYQLYDATGNVSSGHFMLNGVAQPSNIVIDLTAAQAAQTSFVAGAIDDNIQIRAYDGQAWSTADSANWAPFTLGPGVNNAPLVTTSDRTVTAGQSISLASLITVNDTDGDAMTRYQLYDATGNPASGHFLVNGVAQPSNIVIDLTAAQAAQTSFLAGTIDDDIQIRAFDGHVWSAGDSANWSPFHIFG